MNKIIILAFLLSLGQTSWAQMRDFQTSRLNSSAGAGVASILCTEAALLNPASCAFFSGSTLSYQSYSTSLRNESEERKNLNDNFSNTNRSQGLFVSDNDGPLKGGFAYLTQNENDHQRKQLVGHTAASIGSTAAFGVTYKYLTDTLPQGENNRHRVQHLMTLGMSYIIDNDTSLGLVLNDPTLSSSGEERLIGGFQYALASRLTLMADIGTQFTQDVKQNHLWRAAAQLQLFDDFFFRVGQFHDHIRGEKGHGWGLSWVGPRLGVEFAQKISEQFRKEGYLYKGEGLMDTSLSAIIKF
jgi:hypothetical protein